MFRIASESLSDGENMPVLVLYDETPAVTGSLFLTQISGTLYIAAVGTTGVPGSTALTVGTWYELGLSLEGGTTVKVYLNGVEEASDTSTQDTVQYLYAGKESVVGADVAFNFQYKNFKVDSSALPDSCAE
jgi:hypothetical protein